MGRDQRGAHAVRAIAVEAVMDPRTVLRFLRGERVRGTSRLRIERAIRTLRRSDDDQHSASRGSA